LKPDGKKIKETAERYTQVGWRELFLERLYYDNGKLKSEFSEECQGKNSYTKKVTINYHENGKMSQKEERYIEASGKLSSVATYYYDENGDLINKDEKDYR
ncbi:MAG: hypothetical protein J6S34_04780, partial [Clostridia bacterium]|nr:hypothetical protein [Clostridia bacterium]